MQKISGKSRIGRLSAPVFVGALALLLASCQEQEVVEAPKTVAPRPARVMVVSEIDDLFTRNFTGRVDAVQTVDLAFRVSGQLVEMPIIEGQRIAKGDLIAALDPTDYENTVREAQVNFEQKKKDLKRFETLKDKQVISEGQYDNAKTAFDLAEVTLDKAKQNLGYTKIVAPYDAIVTSRSLDNYAIISAGTSIARLQDVSEVRIDINVPETLFAQATESSVLKMTAEFPSHPGKVFPLEYREHSTEADKVAQTYRVTLAMNNDDGYNIIPGMTASVKVKLNGLDKSQTTAFFVPTSAVGSSPDKSPYVWVVDESEKRVGRRKVLLGTVLGSFIPVLSGLKDGEMIVTAGVSHLSENQLIVPKL
ncbi:Toluene efflux pump periplasmic linker protein TtgD precursor [Pseudovibrio sp. Ad13]|uniref:efflux RND transporter periplasmic adaptor subunit n=1 Tax=unclassified Pseudovibrio TaxID=2627060 RepID=UPI0007AECD27|nr:MULTISPECIES: efflux RND transporter periplasmic adaptor subunit [unclassified Pseudovibrio]KZK77599.1 Toluene efflux pump periplasmic linker protein TtgD precursor [Pseudovibrio sp. Ad46]KZK81325.1 Toluene efflux pump periplasmic linker protein TtgD precursor [Pseudovibrio sp. Ad13]KZK93470.1 Toluene efflux pump periplasmic linker protein TtgD precursor [Pseudovibrio sp. Ad5]